MRCALDLARGSEHECELAKARAVEYREMVKAKT
jgi:hypothetical protein